LRLREVFEADLVPARARNQAASTVALHVRKSFAVKSAPVISLR